MAPGGVRFTQQQRGWVSARVPAEAATWTARSAVPAWGGPPLPDIDESTRGR